MNPDIAPDQESEGQGLTTLVPGAYETEIWVSTSTQAAGAFSYFETHIQSALDSPFEATYAPVVPGQELYFKARRRQALANDTSTAWSAWYGPLTVRAPFPNTGTIMSYNLPYTGSGTLLGFGLQASADAPDKPVKMQRIAEYTRGNVKPEYKKIHSKAMRGDTSKSHKVGAGTADFPGSFDIELTPAIATMLLTFMLGNPTTTTIAAAGGVPQHYRHGWLNSKAFRFFTALQRIGNEWRISPGALLNTFEFGIDKEQDSFLTPKLGIFALNHLIYAGATDVGAVSAALDPDDAFSPLDAFCVLNGVQSAECREAGFTMNRNRKPKNVLDRLRGAQIHYPNATDISFTAKNYFSSRDYLDLFLGQAIGTALPYGASKKVDEMDAVVGFRTELNSDGYSFELGFHAPRASMEMEDSPVEGTDEIMEDLTFAPNHDNTLGSDCEIYIINGQTNAEIITAAAALTPVPANKVSAYTSA